ncbi:TPA: DUF2235 domain-containing protein [Pseudomonas aeruginosa]|nr:DUF2235 domain-containing protein [Pseudomonas aeruginosa]
MQMERYRQAHIRAQTVARKSGDSPPMLPCARTLHISLFFDGTNNNEPADKQSNPPTTTNVARLFHASIGAGNGFSEVDAGEQGFYRYYMPGVGTVFEEIKEFEPSNAGLKYATGGENRINWGLTRLIDVLQRTCTKKPFDHDVAYGLVKDMATSDWLEKASLGQASDGQGKRAAVLLPHMQALEKQIAARPKPELLGMQLYVYGFSRGAAEARTFVNWLAELTRQEDGGYRFAGIELSVEFLGLFDTVASVGIADLAPFADGHMGWANDSQRLPDDEGFLRRCVHLVAAHEQRACFPLDSIRRKARPDDPDCPSSYRAGSQEFIYPGVHSDVGGGYPPGEQGKALAGGAFVLSQVALHHMYDAAYRAGAPLQVPELALNSQQSRDWPWLKMAPETEIEFDLANDLVTRFNTWVDQLSSGSLEDVMIEELKLITGWRVERYAYGSQARQPYFQSRQGRDVTPRERQAFETLHQYQLAEDAAARRGDPAPVLMERQAREREEAQAVRRAYEARTGGDPEAPLNTRKAYDPPLEQRQLQNAARDFRRDYIPEWTFGGDGGWSLGSMANVLFGGLVYMTNEVDEAEEYAKLRDGGEKAWQRLFSRGGAPLDDKAARLVALFDEQVHDSRAWFMNAELNAREIWSDYFRYRCIFFDSQSNRSLKLLARGMQVIGVGIALGSIGLSVKRRNPKYLVGLVLPSLGTPVLRGKLGLPQIAAFDPLTGLALPMLEVAGQLAAFSRDSGPAQRLAAALPPPLPLSVASATTPELRAILAAQQRVVTASAATGGAKGGWLEQAAALFEVGEPSSMGRPTLLERVREETRDGRV